MEDRRLSLERSFLVVCPVRRGSSCGLFDHAAVLVAALDPSQGLSEVVTLPAALMNHGIEPVLLQFTPLAYNPYGLPFPLLVAVLRWRFQGRRVVTYFHELPFGGHECLKRWIAVVLQRGICLLLLGSSNAAIVNQRSGLHWLRLPVLRRRPVFLPSFSNVGEAAQVLEPHQRPNQVVIFGSAGKRRHAHCLVRRLGGFYRLFGPDVKVIDVGEPLPDDAPPLPEVVSLGVLPASEIHSLLLQSRYGFFYSEPEQFSKSGVFAAYCANGVIPVIAYDGSGPESYFLLPSELDPTLLPQGRSLEVWQACRQWFRHFSVDECAHVIQRLLTA